MKRAIRVVYHCPCPDGAFAALAAYLKFHKEAQVDLDFIPHSTYRALPVEDNPAFTPDAEVFLLDYVGPSDFVHRVAKKVRHVTLLDHHKTAFELMEQWKSENSLPANFDYQLINEKSGATIAYDHFSKDSTLIADDADRARIERLYAYIEDGDLWRKALPFSKEFSTGLGAKSVEFDFNKNKSLFLQLQLLDADKLIEEGKVEVERVNKIIAANLAESYPIKLGGKDTDFGTCLAVLTTSPELRSEMGHQLAVKSAAAGLRGIGALCYEEAGMENADKNYKVSLRSVEEEDTTVVSKHFGGGGHKNASSFMIAKEQWTEWKNIA
jgi:oligoribonuclease NrnB/cAMP/cGMP phosphodiesterase (DHH superfamily)